MSRRDRSLLASCLALFAGCSSPLSAADYEVPVDQAALERELIAIRDGYGQPAMAAAILRSEGEPVSAVVGALAVDDPTPVLPRHRFHVGSTTKSFTALLTAQLVAEGRLAYTTTLAELFPGVPMRPAYREATVDQLLTNRVGLIPFQQLALEDPIDVEMLTETIPAGTSDPREQRRLVTAWALDRPPRFPPGGQGEYSNVGWAVLGHALEELVDVPYEQLLSERIFAPLRMDGARVGGWPASPDDPDQPRGHTVDAEGLHPQALDDPYRLEAWMNPSGGIHCTIDDYAAYAQEVLRGLQGRGELLDGARYAELHAVHGVERLDRFYQGASGRQRVTLGYGWAVTEHHRQPLSMADGSAGTFYARVALFPAVDVAFVGFTNAGDGESALSEALRVGTGLRW